MGRVLPKVRIKKIKLNNFKCVGEGEVVLNTRRDKHSNTWESDVLGVYGQNGTGKSALIEAIGIVKSLMSNERINFTYANCVPPNVDHSSLEFIFDMRYPNGHAREVTYSFSLKSGDYAERKAAMDDLAEGLPDEFNKYIPDTYKKLIVFDERIMMKDGDSKNQMIIDMSPKDCLFKPDTKRKEMLGNNKKALMKLEIVKYDIGEASRSFVFSGNFFNTIRETSSVSVYYDVLYELYYFAKYYLFVVNPHNRGMEKANISIRITDRDIEVDIPLSAPYLYSMDEYNKVSKIVDAESALLKAMVPGMSLLLKPIEKKFDKEGKPAISAQLVTSRNGMELPLEYESGGIKKLVSILSLFILAFNEESTTLAIDELDEGIFEHLLKEMISVFKSKGKGQLIFTSHNLCLLEPLALGKNHIAFTTANTKHRYIRPKNVAETNNLRGLYITGIKTPEKVKLSQEELLYEEPSEDILTAFRKANGIITRQ